jgi:hypothetical protein
MSYRTNCYWRSSSTFPLKTCPWLFLKSALGGGPCHMESHCGSIWPSSHVSACPTRKWQMPCEQCLTWSPGDNIDYFVDTLCDHCPEIRHIVMERKRGPSKEMLFQLLSRYKDFEWLNVLVPENVFQIDFAKLYGLPCLGPSSFTAVSLDGPR